MPPAKPRSLLRTPVLLTLLLGTVVLPALASLTVGVIALALWREAFDIVFGVLVLVFAVMAIVGGLVTLAFLRRSERLAQMQSDFVANVSHELRTPLAGIRILVETLERDRADSPETRVEVFALLSDRIGRLDELVERILRWRRLDYGLGGYELSPQSLSTLIEEALAPLTEKVKAARITLRVDLPDSLPPVVADREALADAFRNLVDNGIKYGGEGSQVEVVAREGEGEIIVEVRDQGPGIPGRERKRIFERFYRVPVHMRSMQGTGLGLAIVRHVIKGHRGRIRVESEPGIGSVFTIYLPAAAGDLGQGGGGLHE